MDEQFELPVEYKGQEHLFKTILQVYGYSHRFQVEVNNKLIVFKPDEERNYRAVLHHEDIKDMASLDIGLLQAIAHTLEDIRK